MRVWGGTGIAVRGGRVAVGVELVSRQQKVCLVSWLFDPLQSKRFRLFGRARKLKRSQHSQQSQQSQQRVELQIVPTSLFIIS